MTVDEALVHQTYSWSDSLDADVIKTLQAEVMRLRKENDRLRRERAEALSVNTKEGMLASEWVARTGRAENTVIRLSAKLASVEALTRDVDKFERVEYGTMKAGVVYVELDDVLAALRGEP